MIPLEEYKYIIHENSTIAVVEVLYKNEKYLIDPKLLFKSNTELMSKNDAMYE